jgi:hypothetical protein
MYAKSLAHLMQITKCTLGIPPTHTPLPCNFPFFMTRISSTQIITKQLQTHTDHSNKSPTYHSLNPFYNHHPLNKITQPYSYWHTHFHNYSTAVVIRTLLYACFYYYVTFCLLLCTLFPAVTLQNSAFPYAVYLCVLCKCHNTRQLLTWTYIYQHNYFGPSWTKNVASDLQWNRLCKCVCPWQVI